MLGPSFHVLLWPLLSCLLGQELLWVSNERQHLRYNKKKEPRGEPILPWPSAEVGQWKGSVLESLFIRTYYPYLLVTPTVPAISANPQCLFSML